MADLATYALAALAAAFFATPFLWLLSLALRTPSEVFLGAARLIPQAPTLENFARVLGDAAFAGYLWNGVVLSATGAAGAVLVAAPAAYACSRLRFRAKRTVLLGVLAVQMVSPLVIVIPLYRWTDRLGLIDAQGAVVAIYAATATPLCVWVLKAAFDAVPLEIEEAAAIDGCSRPGIVLRITLPLAAPGLASAFVLAMVAGWSQFLVPYLLLERDALWPISVAIFNYAGATGASTTGVLAAACLVAVLPAVAVFAALQRVIMRTLVAGAVKG